MPKIIPEEIKARIVELLKAGRTGADVVRLIAEEFGGYSVSAPSVTKLAPEAGVSLTRGPRRTAKRDLVKLRREQGMTESAIGAELGISRQRISKLLGE